MMRYLLALALALSLLFNVFFAVGYFQARSGADLPDMTVETPVAVEEALKMDERQAAVFEELRTRLRQDVDDLNEQIDAVRQELADELASAEPDMERVRELDVLQADLRRERHEIGARHFREFVGTLSPEQRREMSRQMHRRHWRGGPRLDRVVRRFDADDDGQLSDAEWSEVRTYLEDYCAERERCRARFLERFDLDGDGTLNEQEEAAKDEFFRQKRQGRGWGGEGRRGGPGGFGGPGGRERSGDDRGPGRGPGPSGNDA